MTSLEEALEEVSDLVEELSVIGYADFGASAQRVLDLDDAEDTEEKSRELKQLAAKMLFHALCLDDEIAKARGR